jgi:hypothetical protein
MFCRRSTDVPLIGKWATASAADRYAELNRRGMAVDATDVAVLGGFTVVGGNGLGITPSSVCSILTVPDGVHIVVEIGERAEAVIRYEDMVALEVAGGEVTTGPAFVAGGFGLHGAIEGLVVASVLNAVSERTTINTGMHIGSTKGEVLLFHGELTSQAIRRALSPLWTRYEAKRAAKSTPAATHDDAVRLLARLAELRDAGVLSDEEFSAKKAELLARM